jgi:hypothetical protein
VKCAYNSTYVYFLNIARAVSITKLSIEWNYYEQRLSQRNVLQWVDVPWLVDYYYIALLSAEVFHA